MYSVRAYIFVVIVMAHLANTNSFFQSGDPSKTKVSSKAKFLALVASLEELFNQRGTRQSLFLPQFLPAYIRSRLFFRWQSPLILVVSCVKERNKAKRSAK